jgi:hypothetical protein
MPRKELAGRSHAEKLSIQRILRSHNTHIGILQGLKDCEALYVFFQC